MASIAPATPSETIPKISTPILAATPVEGAELEAELEEVPPVALLLDADAALPVDAAFEEAELLAAESVPLELAVRIPPEPREVEDAPVFERTLVDDVPDAVAVAEAVEDAADEDEDEQEVELSTTSQRVAIPAAV
ncbi:hypothetical protein LTR85_006979 [Meristemomyces frigidus]|nr:hypothetical protein LTR85_006979 [Meristemomyces frigidus]